MLTRLKIMPFEVQNITYVSSVWLFSGNNSAHFYAYLNLIIHLTICERTHAKYVSLGGACHLFMLLEALFAQSSLRS